MTAWMLVLALVMCCVLCGCGDFVSILPGTELVEAEEDDSGADGSFVESPFYTFMGWTDFGSNYYSDTPVALSFQYNPGTEGCISPIFDRASIIAACDALRGMTITGKSSEEESASQYVFTFTMSSGREYTFSFEGEELHTYTGNYTVSGGEALWDITFPAYNSGFDVFDLYFDDSVRSFADNFYVDMPVSVGLRYNSGATITNDDPEVITEVFQALANTSILVVENYPDQNVDLTDMREYIFTMEDGTTYTFAFAQRCIAVQANKDYGMVYYWLDGVDALWNINVSPDNENGKFEGGALSGLRSDIQTAADAADGEGSLTVAGVYVDYDIDGESGYLTLDGDTAVNFVQQLGNISVTDEMTEEVSGDTITVSITLSDSSGPILYFTGDTIQQVVGINYVCSSSDMSLLRTTILSLASDGNNEAELLEGSTN